MSFREPKSQVFRCSGSRFDLYLEAASEDFRKLGAVCDYFELRRRSDNINEFTIHLFQRILWRIQELEWRDADVDNVLKIFSFIVDRNVNWSETDKWKDLCLSLTHMVSSCPTTNKSLFIGCATQIFVKVCDETSIADLLIPIVVTIITSLDVDNEFYYEALVSLLELLNGSSWDTHTVDHLVSEFSAKILDMKHHRLQFAAIQVLVTLVNPKSRFLCFQTCPETIYKLFWFMNNKTAETWKLVTRLNEVATDMSIISVQASLIESEVIKNEIVIVILNLFNKTITIEDSYELPLEIVVISFDDLVDVIFSFFGLLEKVIFVLKAPNGGAYKTFAITRIHGSPKSLLTFREKLMILQKPEVMPANEKVTQTDDLYMCKDPMPVPTWVINYFARTQNPTIAKIDFFSNSPAPNKSHLVKTRVKNEPAADLEKISGNASLDEIEEGADVTVTTTPELKLTEILGSRENDHRLHLSPERFSEVTNDPKKHNADKDVFEMNALQLILQGSSANEAASPVSKEQNSAQGTSQSYIDDINGQENDTDSDEWFDDSVSSNSAEYGSVNDATRTSVSDESNSNQHFSPQEWYDDYESSNSKDFGSDNDAMAMHIARTAGDDHNRARHSSPQGFSDFVSDVKKSHFGQDVFEMNALQFILQGSSANEAAALVSEDKNNKQDTSHQSVIDDINGKENDTYSDVWVEDYESSKSAESCSDNDEAMAMQVAHTTRSSAGDDHNRARHSSPQGFSDFVSDVKKSHFGQDVFEMNALLFSLQSSPTNEAASQVSEDLNSKQGTSRQSVIDNINGKENDTYSDEWFVDYESSNSREFGFANDTTRTSVTDAKRNNFGQDVYRMNALELIMQGRSANEASVNMHVEHTKMASVSEEDLNSTEQTSPQDVLEAIEVKKKNSYSGEWLDEYESIFASNQAVMAPGATDTTKASVSEDSNSTHCTNSPGASEARTGTKKNKFSEDMFEWPQSPIAKQCDSIEAAAIDMAVKHTTKASVSEELNAAQHSNRRNKLSEDMFEWPQSPIAKQCDSTEAAVIDMGVKHTTKASVRNDLNAAQHSKRRNKLSEDMFEWPESQIAMQCDSGNAAAIDMGVQHTTKASISEDLKGAQPSKRRNKLREDMFEWPQSPIAKQCDSTEAAAIDMGVKHTTKASVRKDLNAAQHSKRRNKLSEDMFEWSESPIAKQCDSTEAAAIDMGVKHTTKASVRKDLNAAQHSKRRNKLREDMFEWPQSPIAKQCDSTEAAAIDMGVKHTTKASVRKDLNAAQQVKHGEQDPDALRFVPESPEFVSDTFFVCRPPLPDPIPKTKIKVARLPSILREPPRGTKLLSRYEPLEVYVQRYDNTGKEIDECKLERPENLEINTGSKRKQTSASKDGTKKGASRTPFEQLVDATGEGEQKSASTKGVASISNLRNILEPPCPTEILRRHERTKKSGQFKLRGILKKPQNGNDEFKENAVSTEINETLQPKGLEDFSVLSREETYLPKKNVLTVSSRPCQPVVMNSSDAELAIEEFEDETIQDTQAFAPSPSLLSGIPPAVRSRKPQDKRGDSREDLRRDRRQPYEIKKRPETPRGK